VPLLLQPLLLLSLRLPPQPTLLKLQATVFLYLLLQLWTVRRAPVRPWLAAAINATDVCNADAFAMPASSSGSDS
jgi:hypothetical protein